MASVEFKNNAQSTVADNPLTAGATTLNIATGEGTKFPSAFPFKITLWDASMFPNPGDDSGMEIVKCTARTADALTIVRAQEGTSGVEHSNGERVAMLLTAGHFNDATTGIITKLDTVETNAKDDQIASEVPNTPAGNIVATNVQAAVTELDIEKVAKAGDIMTGDLDQGGNYLLNSASVNALNTKGEGYWFDGADDVITILDDGSIDFGTDGDFYIEIEIMPRDVTRATDYLVNKEAGGIGYGLYLNQDDLYIRLDDNTHDVSAIIGTAVFTNDVRGHILVLFDRTGNATAYINGVSVGTVDISSVTNTISSAGNLHIGQDSAGGNEFSGEIYGHRIGNMLKTATEVKALLSGAPIDFADIGADNLEKITNGDFSAWTGDDPDGWTISGESGADPEVSEVGSSEGHGGIGTGSANMYSTSVYLAMQQDILVIGKRYRYSVNVSKVVSGTIRICVKDDTQTLDTITAAGIYTGEFIATSGGEFVIKRVSACDITIDDISVVRIGCVLDLEQDGIGHNQWLDKSGNKNHGAVTGAMPINLECNHIEKYRQIVAMTDDTAWTDIVPAGYELEKIVFVESASNAATLDLGKTSGASDVFSQVVIAASGITTKTIDETFSMSVVQSLYLNDDGVGTWNSASVTATLFMRRVEL